MTQKGRFWTTIMMYRAWKAENSKVRKEEEKKIERKNKHIPIN
jgi:hypothetical protein